MPHTPKCQVDFQGDLESVLPDLTELCRIHDVSLDLIERSHDLDELLERVLEEYEARLAELPNDALDMRADSLSLATAKKLRALTMFASQAVALKSKAADSTRVREHAESLEESNEQLETALAAAEHANHRLDGVLKALNAGILILDDDGSVLRANRAAGQICGIEREAFVGVPASRYLGDVPRGGDGEVTFDRDDGSTVVLLVARRDLESEGDAEVAMLSDITRRSREIEKRHRMEKLSEVLKTLSVLAHKINNPLTALLGRAQLLHAYQDTDPRVMKAVSVIEESATRIAELVRELAGVVKEGKQEAVAELLSMEGGEPPEAQP